MDEPLSVALKNSLASIRMEGYQVTEQTEGECIRLLDGEASVTELVKEILSRPEKEIRN